MIALMLAGVEISIDDVTAIEGDDTGKFVDVFAPDLESTGTLDWPTDMTIGPDGNLYVEAEVLGGVSQPPDPALLEPMAQKIISRFPGIVTGVVNNVTDRKSAVAIGDVEIPLLGTPYLIDRIGSFAFRVSANSFFQTNTPGAGKLYEIVKANNAPQYEASMQIVHRGSPAPPDRVGSRACGRHRTPSAR